MERFGKGDGRGGTVHHAVNDGIHNFPPFTEVSTVLVIFC